MRTTATFDQIYKEFFDQYQVTPGSLKTYKSCLNIFIKWCDVNGRNKRSLQVSDIRDYLEFVQKEYTLNFAFLLMNSLQSFFRWLSDKNYYDDLTRNIKRPKKDYSYKKIPLSEDQVQILLSSFSRNTLKEKRDFAIISMMLVQGVRCVEVSRMNPEDFRDVQGEKMMMIQRKGQTTKSSMISVDPVYPFILDYTAHPDYRANGSLFSSLNTGKRLTPLAIGTIVSDWLVKSGVKSRLITPHSLRHTAAHTMIKNGCPMEELQVQLGHSDRSITRIYTQYMDNEILIRNNGGKKNFNTFFGNLKINPSIYSGDSSDDQMVQKRPPEANNSENESGPVTPQ